MIEQFLRLLYREGELNKDRDVDLLELLTLLAKNAVGEKNDLPLIFTSRDTVCFV